MRIARYLALSTACCVSFIVTGICYADQAEDEAAIRKNAEVYVEAYNKRDAKAVAEMWSPDAVYTDPDTGDAAVGRDEIERLFTGTLANLGEGRIEVEVSSVKFMSTNVAVENGLVRIIRPNAEPEVTYYSAVNIRRDGKWLLDRVTEESPIVSPPSAYEQLKELEWMIGSWIDQDDEATIQTDCEWTKNQNFMTRSFAVVIDGQVDMAGMQIIGWDPVAKQIRSWVFDSDGGFAEGKWTRKGDRWLIAQAATLPDGRKSSAVNVLRRIDDNAFTWQSIQREIDGDVLPNVDEVLVVRKPAE
jgi:uncharacterized protein (TIGR02246 family)